MTLKLIPYLFSAILYADSSDLINSNGVLSENKNIQMIVEIPAGTNKKIEYNSNNNTFEVNKINQKDRIIDFLPYPANYGFIDSTLMNKENGGDGDALDVLLISEALRTGTVVDIFPIGMLVMNDNNENDTKIIAIPVEKKLQIISVDSFKELKNNYPAILKIIQLWFLNYKEGNVIHFIRWDDEVSAKEEIDKWKVYKNQ
ncbi:MAG: inorganic pyrophosphatase [Gammaproteobacteria bacterium]|nr:inorganic pyrophosphatase [Gammaproteobacteria bacterium]|tara:strand:- start:1694 stop:2296 length:603 start_codon:yes stop_codon:yes gene_type:complete